MENFDTKLKGDIAEQAVILYCLKKGWNVLKPIGDRLPYDLVLEINSMFVKIQVKSAWFEERSCNYVVDTRRTKTNRKIMLRDKYKDNDFDFAFVYIQALEVFYIFPVEIFNKFGSEIALVENEKRQRKPISADYRDTWQLLEAWAANKRMLHTSNINNT
jgi:hypothetical protein